MAQPSYVESWALVHMLALSDAYRPKFPALIEAILSGEESSVAFNKVYGRPLAEVQKDLEHYLNRYQFRAVSCVVRFDEAQAAQEFRPAEHDFTCGPQKPQSITVEYEVKPDATLKTGGVIHMIEFH